AGGGCHWSALMVVAVAGPAVVASGPGDGDVQRKRCAIDAWRLPTSSCGVHRAPAVSAAVRTSVAKRNPKCSASSSSALWRLSARAAKWSGASVGTESGPGPVLTELVHTEDSTARNRVSSALASPREAAEK